MSTERFSRADLDLSRMDWTGFDATDDAQIAAQVAADPDTAPLFTAADLLACRRHDPRGEAVPDVRRLRERLGLTQSEFAARYGFGIATLRQYEQGRRVPSGPARTLLAVIAADPDAVTRALIQRGMGA